MKNAFKISLIFILLFSCNSVDDTNQLKNSCSVDNPIEDLDWLKNEIDEREQNIRDDSKYCYIRQALYKNQTVFIYGDCNPLINKVVPVYNCNGEFIGIIGSRNQDIPFEVLTEGQIIWKTSDFACSF